MSGTVTELLALAENGDPAAGRAAFAALYKELRRLARRELARRGPHLSLGATTLLHEAYLDMAGRAAAFPDRNRFMAYAARVMRGLIIDYARRRRAQKRGGAFQLTARDIDEIEASPDAPALEQIGEALDALAEVEPRLAKVVDLKFFCGFTFAEIGGLLGVTERTAQRDWEKARIYLYRTLGGGAIEPL